MLLLDVTILGPKKVIFDGKASTVILPGEQGVFEVLTFHKRMLSRLISGTLFVDEQNFAVKRGVAKVDQNKVIVIIE